MQATGNNRIGLSEKDILEIQSEFDKVLSNKFEEVTGEMLLKKEIKDIPCLVEPFLQQTGLACLAGSSDTGKSSLLRQLAISIVVGKDNFLGFKINSINRSVIYVSTEDLLRETAYLLKRQAQEYLPEQLKGLRFIFDTENLENELKSRLNSSPADLIIIDCFSDSFGGDLKDTQKIRNNLQIYQNIASNYDCLVLFLHHTSKRTEYSEPSKNNLLSGQGFEAKMRLVIELRADCLSPNTRHLCIVKGNYLPANQKRESYVLKFDENKFQYSNTGMRIPFEQLVKSIENNKDKERFEFARELKESGKTYDEIAQQLGYSSKGSVAKLFKKASNNGWSNSNINSSSSQKKLT